MRANTAVRAPSPLRLPAPMSARGLSYRLICLLVGPCPFCASAGPAECPQGDPGDREDCLCLNVWRPAGTTAASALPVYVYIHGGGFIIGSGKFGWTIGANLAANAKIVAVTLNYRLGPLGFMVTDEQSGVGNGGMNGLLDSIAALEFVQKHIGRFGGDPTRVTIGGQSSGSSAVCTLAV